MKSVQIYKTVICLLILFTSFFLYGQNLIKGSVVVYNHSFEPTGINILVIDTIPNNEITGAVTGSSGTFKINSVPNGKIDLEFSFIGCYKTILKGIELNNDTVEIQNIPVFENDCEIAWDGFCEKKILWGLIKIKRACGGTEYYNNSPFPDNNKIYMDCKKSDTDSILFELDPLTKDIEVDYEIIKACGNIVYGKQAAQ
jgi:hypothetical protein